MIYVTAGFSLSATGRALRYKCLKNGTVAMEQDAFREAKVPHPVLLRNDTTRTADVELFNDYG